MTRTLFFPLTLALLLSPQPTGAQSEGHLKQALEGRYVVVKLDMPATKEGVNLRINRLPNIDYNEHRRRLQRYGTSLPEGAAVQITLIKVKGKHIEFHLGGGGYGVWGDESFRTVGYTPTPPSEREKKLLLEQKTLPKKFPETHDVVKEELERLALDRQREDARRQAEAAEKTEELRQRVREKALASGSRFNVRFDDDVPDYALTPEGFMRVLADYVDFSAEAAEEAQARQAAERAAAEKAATDNGEEEIAAADVFGGNNGSLADLRKGQSWSEVVSLLGPPRSHQFRREGALQVATSLFRTEWGLVEALFVEDVLVRFTLSSN